MIGEAAYLHSIDPFAIRFTESFGIRWYGLSYLGGFFMGYLSILLMVHNKRSPFPRELLSDFIFIVAVGCILGGRLGYCLFYRPELLFDFRASPPFWGVFAFHEGGMASHGGILGIIIACIWYARKHKLMPLHLLDLTILGATLGIFFGRVANFINGELVGRACNGGCWFPVKFPQDLYSWISYAPEKLKSLAPGAKAVSGLNTAQWETVIQRGDSYSISQTIEKMILAAKNGNQEMQTLLQEVLIARHPSQLYASFLEGLGIFLVLLFVWRKPQKPGVIVASFLFLYSIGRTFGEQFRQPDLHLGFQALGLTRGQWLSVALFVGSLVFLISALRADREKIGGWASN